MFSFGLVALPLAAQVLTGDDAPFVDLGPLPDTFTLDASGGNLVTDPRSVTIKNQSVATRIMGGVFLPSSWVGPYTLSIVGRDDAGNAAIKEVPLFYDPPRAGLTTAVSSRVQIPAIAQSVKDAQGRNPITTEVIKRTDGSVLGGTLPLKAALRADSTIPLKVNGVQVEPGAPPVDIGSFNFSASTSLSLPLAAVLEGVEGEAQLAILIGDQRAPVVETTVNTWSATVNLAADAWTVRQALDPVRLTLTSTRSLPCRLVASQTPTRSVDVCRVQFTNLPEGLRVSQDGTSVTGRVWTTGEQEVAYKVLYFDGAAEVVIASGARTLASTSSYGVLSFGSTTAIRPIVRGLESVEIGIQQNGGQACSLSNTLDAAKAVSANDGVGCVLKWGTLPTGMAVDTRSGPQRVKGTITAQGNVELAWVVNLVSPSGQEVRAAEGSLAIETLNPETPSIQFIPTASEDAGRLLVPVNGGVIGDAVLTAARSTLGFEIRRDGATISTETIDGTRSRDAQFSTKRRVSLGGSAVWQENDVVLRVFYRDLPDVSAEYPLRTLAIAPMTVKPLIQTSTTAADDTDALPVTVSIRDTNAPTKPYDANVMGVWKVRVVSIGASNSADPITDYVDATGGEASFSVSLASLGGKTIRLAAQAQLDPSGTGQSRVEVSPKAVNVSVLRGGKIAGSLAAERLVGPAPLLSVFQLKLDDARDQSSIGNITWEISDDDGKTFKANPAGTKSISRFSSSFPAGDYQVRAKIINKNSKQESYTESVVVTAFDVPGLDAAGSSTVFVGGSTTITANPVVKNPTDTVVVEWSMNDGKSWEPGERTYELSRSSIGKVPLRVRARLSTAPAELATAWSEVKVPVDFVAIRAPSVRLLVPQAAETERKNKLRANVTLPYPRMDGKTDGEWVLPDGTRVSGTELDWYPTSADEAKGTADIEYVAWVEGFRDQGAESVVRQSIKVWTYRWPEWQSTSSMSYDVAPTDAVIRVYSLSPSSEKYLENVAMKWTIPAGLTVTDASRDNSRRLRVDVAGEYPIDVTVKDGRGYEAVVPLVLVAKEAPAVGMTLDLRTGNRFNRAPLEVMVLPRLSGGHPRDSATSFRFLVDGNLVGETANVGRLTLAEGDHVISVEVRTKMGQTAVVASNVSVKPNQTPTCTGTRRDMSTGWYYNASCSDPDGRVMSYRWFVDGKEEGLRSDRISVSRRGRTEPPEVTLIGVDDAGAESAPVPVR